MYGHALEILGHYHPLQKDEKDKLVLNKERIEHWLSKGAQTSNTVHNLLVEAGIIKGDKKRSIGLYKSKKEAPAEEAKPVEKKEEAPKTEATPAETPKEEPKAEEKPAEEAKDEAKA